MAKKCSYRLVGFLGYLCFTLTVINVGLDYYGRLTEGRSFNPGVALGNEAMALIGIVAFAVARCLKNIEERLPPE